MGSNPTLSATPCRDTQPAFQAIEREPPASAPERSGQTQTLFRYAQSLRGSREYGSENNLNVLLLAHQLAPQVAAITMNAAALLIGRGDNALAVPLLRPLAADPHNAGLAQAARHMIDVANGVTPSATPTPATPPATPPAPQRPN